jgi:hypothetical protein
MSALPQQQLDYLSSLYQQRARILGEYADKVGQDKILASLLGLSPARLHRLVRKQDVPFTEKMARAIELRLDKPTGWLDGSQAQAPTSQYACPVYLLEDLGRLQSAKPATHINYICDVPNAYFIQILSSSYEPKVSQGAKILINPKDTDLQSDKMYIVSYEVDDHWLRPVLRIFRDGMFFTLASNESESVETYRVHGRCELIINKA